MGGGIRGDRDLQVRGLGNWRIGQFWDTQRIYALCDFTEPARAFIFIDHFKA